MIHYYELRYKINLCEHWWNVKTRVTGVIKRWSVNTNKSSPSKQYSAVLNNIIFLYPYYIIIITYWIDLSSLFFLLLFIYLFISNPSLIHSVIHPLIHSFIYSPIYTYQLPDYKCYYCYHHYQVVWECRDQFVFLNSLIQPTIYLLLYSSRTLFIYSSTTPFIYSYYCFHSFLTVPALLHSIG